MLLVALLWLAQTVQDNAAPAPKAQTVATSATAKAPEQVAGGGQRWSILADPCASAKTSRFGEPDEVVVCGKGLDIPRLPLPGDRGPPDRPMPSNPDGRGIDALALTQAPCATRMEGCLVGVDVFGAGTAAVRLIGKAINPDSCCEEPGESTNFFKLVGDAGKGVGRMFRKKPDKSNRIPINLDDPAWTPETAIAAAAGASRPSPAILPTPPAAPASPTDATGAASRGP